MFDTPLFDFPPVSLLHELFKYASPILVGMESIKSRKSPLPGKIYHWVKVLETTRILLAHASMDLQKEKDKNPLLKIIATNMVNLYRLFDLDLCEKETWMDIQDEFIYYVEPDSYGRFFVSLDSVENIVTSLKKEKVIGMQDEFHLVKADAIDKHIFGHCLYTLVATRDGKWKDDCSSYKDLHRNV